MPMKEWIFDIRLVFLLLQELTQTPRCSQAYDVVIVLIYVCLQGSNWCRKLQSWWYLRHPESEEAGSSESEEAGTTDHFYRWNFFKVGQRWQEEEKQILSIIHFLQAIRLYLFVISDTCRETKMFCQMQEIFSFYQCAFINVHFFLASAHQ